MAKEKLAKTFQENEVEEWPTPHIKAFCTVNSNQDCVILSERQINVTKYTIEE